MTKRTKRTLASINNLKLAAHPLYLRPLAGVAQLVEQRIRNARVGSSNLFSGTIS